MEKEMGKEKNIIGIYYFLKVSIRMEKEMEEVENIILDIEYLNGKKNGKGKEYNSFYRLIFEGEFFGGIKWNGKGYDESRNIVYELKNWKGYINLTRNGKLIHEGECYYGEFSGIGKKDISGFKYEGEFIKDQLEGYGIIYDLDGVWKWNDIFF